MCTAITPTCLISGQRNITFARALHIWISNPNQQEKLIQELYRVFPTSNHKAMSTSWVKTIPSEQEKAVVRPVVAFAQQVLPNTSVIDSKISHKKLVEAISTSILEQLGTHNGYCYTKKISTHKKTHFCLNTF